MPHLTPWFLQKIESHDGTKRVRVVGYVGELRKSTTPLVSCTVPDEKGNATAVTRSGSIYTLGDPMWGEDHRKEMVSWLARPDWVWATMDEQKEGK